MAYQPFIESAKGAFGESITSQLTPVSHLQFPYNLNPLLATTRLNHGTASVDANRLKLSTGAGANQSAQVVSRRTVPYQPGQGNKVRTSVIFTEGKEGSSQVIGIGDVSDGYLFGYRDATFGYIRTQGGSQEMQTLTITVGSSDAEDITITLDGDALATVTVTASGDTTTTANEIGDQINNLYRNLGTGWFTKVAGPLIEFLSFDAAPHTGVYSLSGANSAVGAFSQDVAGVVPTTNPVDQASWNLDKADGITTLPLLVHTNGNVFEISYQWLGFGGIVGSIESGLTSRFVKVNIEHYSNSNTIPSVDNPTLPLCAFVKNTTNDTAIVMFVGSMGGFIEGAESRFGIRRGAERGEVAVGTTEIPLLTVHNRLVYNGVINRVRVRISIIGAENDGTKSGRAKVYRDVILTGASFVDIDTDNSVVSVDTSATAMVADIKKFWFSIPLAKSDSHIVLVDDFDEILYPGEFLTISGVATGASAAMAASINVTELF